MLLLVDSIDRMKQININGAGGIAASWMWMKNLEIYTVCEFHPYNKLINRSILFAEYFIHTKAQINLRSIKNRLIFVGSL